MQIPDVLGWNVNEARREIRNQCPNLSIVIQETHSRKEPKDLGIETAKVIRQTHNPGQVILLVAFFGDVYTDRVTKQRGPTDEE